MTLAELKTQLGLVESKISEILSTGQEYNIVGSHSVKNTQLADLHKQAALLRKRIYRFQGYLPRTLPDFSTGSDKYVKDYI